MVENEYSAIMNELKELKELVKDLKKEIKDKDIKIDELKELILTNNTDCTVKRDLEEVKLFESKDPIMCYHYVLNHQDMDYKELEKIVLDSKDLEANYQFMVNIPNCKFKEHLKVITDSKDPEYNYYIAINTNLNEKDIATVRQVILDSKNLEYVYRFASDLKHIYNIEDTSNIDISEFERVIIDSLNFKYYYLFCKNVNNANIELFQKALLELANANDIEHIFDFAVDIKGTNLELLRSKIVDLYNEADKKQQKEIVSSVDTLEKRKIKCLFRNTFADEVVIN